MSGQKNLRMFLILLFITISLCSISVNTYAANKPNTKPKTLAKVQKPILSALGNAGWSDVANAKAYQVQLYANGLPMGTPKIVNSGKTGYDFLTIMRAAGAGSYTVKVKAKGDGKVYSDGPLSSASNPQCITKAAVKDINLSRDGVATWTSVNASSEDLKLYHDDSLIDTQEGAVTGYDYLNTMRSNGPGKYTITVTAHSDAGLIIDGDESPKSNSQTVSNLRKIDRPVWKNATLTWKSNPNASFYEIKLYEGDNPVCTQTVGSDKNSYDFGAYLSADPTGIYIATVKAKGSGLYLYGEESQPSAEIVNPPLLAPFEQPLLSPYGHATWPDIANATNYQVQLYHDNQELGSPITVVSGEEGIDFLPEMRKGGGGSYTFRVTAKGDGPFKDGEQSPDSNEQVIGAADTFNGTVENTFEPTEKVSKDKNDIIITSVSPKEVQAGEETEITMVVEYNLVGQDVATLAIFSNWGETSLNSMETTFCDIYRGSGRLLFRFKVTPKHWSDGQPFWVSAGLVRADCSRIVSTKQYDLKLKNVNSDSFQSDLSSMQVTEGIKIETDGPAFYVTIDKSELPVSIANAAYFAIVGCDDVSEYSIQNMSEDMKKQKSSLIAITKEKNSIRWDNFDNSYQVLLFYDESKNLIGYYIYEVTQN